MVALYNEMMDAMLEIEARCGKHRRINRQFREPIDTLFLKARTFLTASEHLENLRTRANKQAFDSVLMDQGKTAWCCCAGLPAERGNSL